MAVAVSFSLVVNLLLLCTVVWNEVASPGSLRLAWSLVGGFWCAALVFSYRNWPAALEAASVRADRPDTFPTSLSQYLQGNWFEVERLCRAALTSDPRDADSRLLLASTLRRTDRFAEALEQLDLLSGFTTGAKWTREIASERQQIAERFAQQAAELTTDAGADGNALALAPAVNNAA
ncbi:MAG TPA: hypothetical protein VG713_10540 [Pirellulales bacterium]|nr:hypothetical protein [Pirellulales bacterium]